MENTQESVSVEQVPEEVKVVSMEHTNKVLAGSFKWMAVGLFLSAITSLFVLTSETIMNFVYDTTFGFNIILILEIAMVWYLAAKIKSIPANVAKYIFLAYSIVSGMTLSVIFLVFQMSSIVSIFFSTAVMFALLAIYGLKTKKDLTKWGQYAYFALIGLILASIVNLFISGLVFDLVICWVGVIVFTIITAYDVQKIKKIGAEMGEDEDGIKKASIMGALNLYLDFINLFLYLLRLFGKRR